MTTYTVESFNIFIYESLDSDNFLSFINKIGLKFYKNHQDNIDGPTYSQQ